MMGHHQTSKQVNSDNNGFRQAPTENEKWTLEPHPVRRYLAETWDNRCSSAHITWASTVILLTRSFHRQVSRTLLNKQQTLVLFYPQKSHRHLHRGIRQCSSAKVQISEQNTKQFADFYIKMGEIVRFRDRYCQFQCIYIEKFREFFVMC